MLWLIENSTEQVSLMPKNNQEENERLIQSKFKTFDE